MAKLGFGELELSILKIIRELKRVSVREVYEKLESEWSYTTIMTVMSRMVEKTELTREKEGKHYTYWISSKSECSSKTILRRIQNRIFDGNPIAMIDYLINTDNTMSARDLKEIENLIKEKRAQLSEKI